ncbi:up-regulator of cell proliferation [Lepisosteus oculatus]|uniref:up-regulator of cell proliferation n=1 Tax=Lepisosteus oculatus TaxID=7918 RepID=UPI0037224E7B
MAAAHTKVDCLEELLCKLGLEQLYPGKLTLSSMLEISRESITDEQMPSLRTLPWLFLKRLMMINADARCISFNNEEADIQKIVENFESMKSIVNLYNEESADENLVNPLDVITALFLCADSFFRQEMMLKMSMCQFALPLLLPKGHGNQCTLMLWALQDILKEWRPHYLAETRGFEEDNIVHAEMPLISFVRLRDCSFSKSQVLNQVFSNPQQFHNFFMHRGMECGDIPRTVSSGLVEIFWYLPCGNKNLDIFPGPVAITNLRGDICSFQTQFTFLMQTSSAVFVFLDRMQEAEYNFMASLNTISTELFLVINSEGVKKKMDSDAITNIVKALKLEPKNMLIKTQRVNEAKFANMLSAAIKRVMQSNCKRFNLQSISAKAQDLGISLDEVHDSVSCSIAKTRAEEIIKGIGVRVITEYKAKYLPLQGELWRRLAKLEKEECRLKNSGDQRLEEYKSQLKDEKQRIREDQSKYKVTRPMWSFIDAVSAPDRTERIFFLKWLRIKLDMTSRKRISVLRHRYNEQCNSAAQDRKAIAELDQQLLDSSLGIEHYMREMGQIYEASLCGSETKSPQVLHLPSLAADLLLDGFPLELVDGDASNIPVRWVSDVLMQLHKKVGECSRLLVVAVLGVQSTGKSTLLNTMFGANFSVSSGRCTRGAFMLFLRVKEELKEELGCDFVLLIDTEGLKSPELAQLEDSHEHDNELATLVTGLSDVTIINIAMENSTEMKDILQIVVHAFLRMSEVGKKPKCQFVHQNVPGVSAHKKNITERKQLLELLNEMTQIAAAMEKQPTVKKFTDVLDYDADKNNWYIPGLWHGTPPMAPVNTGYSEAVYEFKQNLFGVLKSCKDEKPPSQIPEFLLWMSSLWKAVKYENFIFSFRNTLVADAYNNLCIEFSNWEWSFRKHMYSWLANAEDHISNFQLDGSSDEISSLEVLLRHLKMEASSELTSEEKMMMDKLKKYYGRKERHIPLVEKYKADFLNSIKCLRKEVEHSLNNKLENAVELSKEMTKVKEIHHEHTALVEQKVLQLLEHCKNRNIPLSNQQLKEEFEKMWNDTVSKLNFRGLERKDIHSIVLHQLRHNLDRRGSSVNEELNKIENLVEYGHKNFEARGRHLKKREKIRKVFLKNDKKAQVQKVADAIFKDCKQFVLEKTHKLMDFNEIYIQELLQNIDEFLKKNTHLPTNSKFEVDLKLCICGFAAQAFHQMHENFLREKDPRRHLEKFKAQYCSDFQDLYNKKDQDQKTAQDFTDLCLRPAVVESIRKALGIELVDEILASSQSVHYSSRYFFQFTILKELLEKNNFHDYVSYILTYETYVKDWIFNHIMEHFSKEASVVGLKVKCLENIMAKVERAIEMARNHLPSNYSENPAEFLQRVCRALGTDIVIPLDAIRRLQLHTPTKCDLFAQSLLASVKELKARLQAEFSEISDIKGTLVNLPVRPQDELFKRVFGCGEQCPFCKVPCEAGGRDHREHYALVHRPQGLGYSKYVFNNKLVETICTSEICSEHTFENIDTQEKPHPFKDYKAVYPDWNIPPDISIEASDYWKYVLVQYNELFAEWYNVVPADFPPDWRSITQQKALDSLKTSFNIK